MSGGPYYMCCEQSSSHLILSGKMSAGVAAAGERQGG